MGPVVPWFPLEGSLILRNNIKMTTKIKRILNYYLNVDVDSDLDVNEFFQLNLIKIYYIAMVILSLTLHLYLNNKPWTTRKQKHIKFRLFYVSSVGQAWLRQIQHSKEEKKKQIKRYILRLENWVHFKKQSWLV